MHTAWITQVVVAHVVSTINVMSSNSVCNHTHDHKPNWTLLGYIIIYLLIKAIIVGRYARSETGYSGDHTGWGFSGISLHGWGSGDSSPQFLQSGRVWGWGRWVCITAQSWWKIPVYWSQVSLKEGISPVVFVVKNVSSYLPDKKYKFSPPPSLNSLALQCFKGWQSPNCRPVESYDYYECFVYCRAPTETKFPKKQILFNNPFYYLNSIRPQKWRRHVQNICYENFLLRLCFHLFWSFYAISMIVQSMEILNWFLFINYPYPRRTDCFVAFDLADLLDRGRMC